MDWQTIIGKLQQLQIGEIIRDLDLEGQISKGTPTMGGIIILLSIIVPCLLVGILDNVYMSLMLLPQYGSVRWAFRRLH